MQPNWMEQLRAPNLMFPVSRRELTPVRSVLSGCRGVVGLVPQPLCMKLDPLITGGLKLLITRKQMRNKHVPVAPPKKNLQNYPHQGFSSRHGAERDRAT